MKLAYRTLSVVISLLFSLSVLAGPVDEGKRLYNEGNYEAAAEQLRAAVRRSPRNANANYWLGASLYAMNLTEQATSPLETAAERGVTQAYPLLVRIAISRYDAEAASDYIDSWRSRLTRNRKPIPEELEELSSKAIQMRNMLARVEKIEILDSLTVPKTDFFNAYRLSAPAGRILPAEAVERIGLSDETTALSTAYMPENKSEILWAAADTSGVFALYGAGILDDGTPDHAGPIDLSLGDGGSAAFPFLMPDGVTLYFANNGANSIGGYDIFMTRRSDSDDGKEYFQPQNIGMPYNSPYDDYMLAIDEASGLGWWATDRYQIPDSVTIYIFQPSAVRINVQPDDENLVALAKLSDIVLTQNPDTNYRALLNNRLPDVQNHTLSTGNAIFALDLGNGKIYTTLSDFKDPAARSAMTEYLGAEASLRRHLEQENTLRARYSRGDMSVAGQILESESETALMRRHAAALRNNAVRLETQNR